jgi:hypothetical protein
MPSPTRNTRNLSKPLANLTVAAMQEDKDFVGFQAAPFVDVDHQEGKYYTYSFSDWNRREMAVRGSSSESEGGSYSVSNDTYACVRKAVHKDEDWTDAADADAAFNVAQDASEYLSNQIRLELDYTWQSKAMATSVWTLDWDGVGSGTPSSSEVLRWSVSTSDPQSDLMKIKAAMKALIGKEPNVGVIGYNVYRHLIVNPVVRYALQYTQATMNGVVSNKKMLADFLGLDTLIVAGGVYESAAEGATSSLANLINTNDGWFGYVNPNPGLKKISAMYTFVWKGNEGAAQNGVIGRQFDIDEKTTTRYETEIFYDMKVVSASCGCFIDDLTA